MSLYDLLAWWPTPEPMVGRADIADAARLAELHAESFHQGWPMEDFARMIGDERCLLHVVRRRADAEIGGFIVSRLAADEAEILTVVIARRLRGRGFAARLLGAQVPDLMRAGVTAWFLEVAADNRPARALYRRQGFAEIGIRKGYYRSGQATTDAIAMRRELAPL